MIEGCRFDDTAALRGRSRRLILSCAADEGGDDEKIQPSCSITKIAEILPRLLLSCLLSDLTSARCSASAPLSSSCSSFSHPSLPPSIAALPLHLNQSCCCFAALLLPWFLRHWLLLHGCFELDFLCARGRPVRPRRADESLRRVSEIRGGFRILASKSNSRKVWLPQLPQLPTRGRVSLFISCDFASCPGLRKESRAIIAPRSWRRVLFVM